MHKGYKPLFVRVLAYLLIFVWSFSLLLRRNNEIKKIKKNNPVQCQGKVQNVKCYFIMLFCDVIWYCFNALPLHRAKVLYLILYKRGTLKWYMRFRDAVKALWCGFARIASNGAGFTGHFMLISSLLRHFIWRRPKALPGLRLRGKPCADWLWAVCAKPVTDRKSVV